ncbi:uncharacterized protein C8orf48 homolog isoform X2 [Falco peregrinus]|uniref:uncharacterized protein C8orf48 homolog isoform X2 n=1 Tax=Falco peregrinus TaxID=8954 RepID=UPI002479D064|nr:uncharacterized protein C8orf48 homolog isoform X2 [Falco peregrinus]
MTTASADSSGSYTKWPMELSRSYSSSGLDYAEDTFESFSEEEEACRQWESKPSESYCSTEDLEGSAVSDTLDSVSRLAGQNHADEHSEVADSAATEGGVMGKWIDLKNKEAGIKQDKFIIKTHAEITELLDGELDAFRAFCTIKISKMRQQLISRQATGGKSRKLQHRFTGKKRETNDLNCIVPDELMNRIRLKNIRETVKQVTEAQIHESLMCPDCQKKEAELAEITFLRQKKILMESALIQEKLEEQIYSRDVLTLIGEALRSFPKPSEDPRNLWQRLKAFVTAALLAGCRMVEASIWTRHWRRAEVIA